MNHPTDPSINDQIAALVDDYGDIILEHLGHLPGFGGPLAELLDTRRASVEPPMAEAAPPLSPTERRLRVELLASAKDGLAHNAMLLALAHHGDEAAAVRDVIRRLRAR